MGTLYKLARRIYNTNRAKATRVSGILVSPLMEKDHSSFLLLVGEDTQREIGIEDGQDTSKFLYKNSC